jgi:hypothetical protein
VTPRWHASAAIATASSAVPSAAMSMTVWSSDVRGGHCHGSDASTAPTVRWTVTPSGSTTRRVDGTLTWICFGAARVRPRWCATLHCHSTAPAPHARIAADSALAWSRRPGWVW